jgi:hypothetical protein
MSIRIYPEPTVTSSSINTWVKTASGGETSFSGTGNSGYGSLTYTVGQELVYLNGVLLLRGVDYVASNGTSIDSLLPLLLNDIITVWTVNSFAVANTYTQEQAIAAFAPASAALSRTLLSTNTLSGSSTVISGINQTYAKLYVVASGITSSANSAFRVSPNGSTNLFSGSGMEQDSTPLSFIDTYITHSTPSLLSTNTANSMVFEIDNYSSTTLIKPVVFNYSFLSNTSTRKVESGAGYINSSSAITSLTISTSTGNHTGGTIKVYGVK